MLSIRPALVPPSHEDCLLARYDRMLTWAARIIGSDPDAAEDLVHDAFVRFLLTRPPLSDIDNLDGYLYTMLRNLHLSRVRRGATVPTQQVSFEEFESAEAVLQLARLRGGADVRAELLAICAYLCHRKQSSKPASILILRFFHGYYPAEIARVLQIARASVDSSLRFARQDVATHVHDAAAALSKCAAQSPHSVGKSRIVRFEPASEDCIGELHRMILASTQGPCVPAETFAARRESRRAQLFDCQTLAHIVSCKSCLTRLSADADVPPPDERSPLDTLANGPRTASRRRAGSKPRDILAQCRARVQATTRQAPLELHVVANGFSVGLQHVAGAVNVQELAIHLDEPLGFIEVFTERGDGLCYWPIELPPDGAAEQVLTTDLGQGRTLDLSLMFASTWPRLRVIYTDQAVEPTAARAALSNVMSTNVGWRFFIPPAWRFAFVILLLALLVATPTVRAAVTTWIDRAIEAMRSVMPPDARPTPVPEPKGDIDLPVANPPPATPAATVAVATPAALPLHRRATWELAALARLQEAGAYIGQEVTIQRSDERHAHVQVLVEAHARRLALAEAVRGVHGGQDVLRIAIDAAESLSRNRTTTQPTELRSYTFSSDRMPAYSLVREYLLGRQTLEPSLRSLDEDIAAIANRLLSQSQQASVHAWALKQLADSYPPTIVERLDPAARQVWRRIVNQHLRGFGSAMAAIQQELEPILPAPSVASESIRDTSPRSLWDAVPQLLALNARQDEALRAFSVSAEGVVLDALLGTVFRSALAEAERLTSALETGTFP